MVSWFCSWFPATAKTLGRDRRLLNPQQVRNLGCKPGSATSCLADLGKVICLRGHKTRRLGSVASGALSWQVLTSIKMNLPVLISLDGLRKNSGSSAVGYLPATGPARACALRHTALFIQLPVVFVKGAKMRPEDPEGVHVRAYTRRGRTDACFWAGLG